ncbi:hypothetical protein LOTGIDRAFT_162081 [Lottia gigantea]|uniref:DOMON domain-containing protein n=1 Tax=Lottia gigantea TaxID=225164 RepID=V4A8J0_LOTGI|nr:hypothetical protein LOTGIDRAFT_162081 [Lottia gigantea]ESO93057.1 hypothetical protein LOTGIDRAFT_162081 [Lottia gigantea]
MEVFISLTLILCLLCNCVHGYGSYKSKIPNGNYVPHPCKVNYIWQGVGHRKKEGAGYRNPFGEDFKTAGKVWTKELCQKDSDGDGMTNGQELGDPSCSWTAGDNPPTAEKISHPGICEPWTDPKCQHQLSWLESECEPDKFDCPALQSDPDIKNMTLRFPLTDVPIQDTSYICTEFEVDSSDDFHLIATEMLVNNTNVMHHALLFGCSSDNHTLRSTPHQCGMIASDECGEIIAIWTIGLSGQCFHENVGFRIGSQGFKRVALQFHWNNPTLETNYKDQSGMVLYYTKNKRMYDAGTFLVGASYLEIPGQTVSLEETALCPGVCTSRFITPEAYIVSAANHMHYLGRVQQIEQFRNGTKVRDLTNDQNYNYDDPSPIHYKTPIKLLPGDTIKTRCVFNSQNRDQVTYFGDATSDEMCFGFFTYYPKENIKMSSCTSWKSLPYCAVYSGEEYLGCNFVEFRSKQGMFTEIRQNCSTECTTECLSKIELLMNHACMKGDYYDLMKTSMLRNNTQEESFFIMLENCKASIPTKATTTEKGANEATTMFVHKFLLLTTTMVISLCGRF